MKILHHAFSLIFDLLFTISSILKSDVADNYADKLECFADDEEQYSDALFLHSDNKKQVVKCYRSCVLIYLTLVLFHWVRVLPYLVVVLSY